MTNLLLNLPDLPVPLDLDALFDSSGPLEIEVGVGKGRFLRERAAQLPDHRFLGIEKSRKWLLHGAQRISKTGVTNVRLVQCYVEGFLERYVPDATVSLFHVYFPDPWPKQRHHKRRLFSSPFIRQIIRTLTPQGEVHIATDHMEYYRVIRESLEPFARIGLQTEAADDLGPFQSNFQVKYLREGRPLAFAVARRCS